MLFSAITCPALTRPNNGSVSYGGTSNINGSYPFNSTATYNCDTGFSLVGNNDTKTCTGDGSSTTGVFNGMAPTCECELVFLASKYLVSNYFLLLQL